MNTNIYLLTKEIANMEYSEIVSYGAYASIDGAKKEQERMLTKNEFDGEDATNEWREDNFDKNILEFRTGAWGYVIYKIRPIMLKLDL